MKYTLNEYCIAADGGSTHIFIEDEFGRKHNFFIDKGIQSKTRNIIFEIIGDEMIKVKNLDELYFIIENISNKPEINVLESFTSVIEKSKQS